MSNEPAPTLTSALAAYQAATVHSYLASEKALAEVLLALTVEVTHLRRDLMAATASPEIMAELRSLRAQVEELQQRSPGAPPQPAWRKKTRPPAPSAYPSQERPMEYWVEHAPDFGEETTVAQRAAYLQQPRVRAQDIQLTAEDLKRQERVRHRSRHSLAFRPGVDMGPAAPAPARQWAGVLLIIVMLAVLGFILVF